MQEYAHEYAEHWLYYTTPLEKNGGIWPIRAGHNRTKPHFKIGPRIINYYSLHFVLNGKGKLVQGNMTKELKKGDVFCLFPKQTHYYITDPDDCLELFWLALDGKQIVSLLNRIGFTPYSFHIESFITDKIIEVLQEIIRHFQQYLKDDELQRLSFIFKLLHHLSVEASSRKLSTITPVNWIQKSKQYMDTHYTEDITVRDVAKYIGVHRSHFTKEFVNEFGITPVQYLLSLKMNRAKEMLSEKSFSITEIAYSLGYSDLYSFSRAFKNFFGVSPTKYVGNEDIKEIREKKT